MKVNSIDLDPVKRLITIGRLNREKGHERLLHELSKLKVPFHYTIVGDGPEKENIFKLAKTLDLTNKITHVPYTNNVAKFLGENDLFLQGSFVEGFPNTALESCVVGTPVIAFECMGGTREIIENGVNGFIANDSTQYHEYVEKALAIEWDPKSVRSSVTKKFSKDIILPKYEEFFQSLEKKYNL